MSIKIAIIEGLAIGVGISLAMLILSKMGLPVSNK